MNPKAYPKVSVVLCSRDRATQVSRCLNRFDIQALKEVQGELVLVDNGSSDLTRQVFEDFRTHNPDYPVQVYIEEKKGLSIARNTGVERCQGELIVFLDDDVYLGEKYFQKVISIFQKMDNSVGVVGGRILRFDPEDSLYCCQLSDQHRHFTKGSTVRPGLLQGANFAIRRQVFDRIDGFDVALGAGQKYRCEDIDFIARALKADWDAVYNPQLVVYHHHGRKDGDDVELLRHDNSYASGAFFAKMLRLGYRDYWSLLAIYVLSAPIRPNMKLASFRKGWRDYRDEYPSDAF